MNRIGKQWVPALGLLLWLPASAGAHVGDRLYPVSWLSDEMLASVDLHDGSIEEWYELLGEPAMTTLDFRKLGEEALPDPASLDFRIWLAWHDDPARFYVAFVAADDVYKNTHDYSVFLESSMSNNDSIQLSIDGDHSGGERCRSCIEEEDYAEARGQTQGYDAIARTPEGPTLDDSDTRYFTGEFAWTVLPPYGEAGGSVAGEAPVISVIEFYVTPFDWWGNGFDVSADNVVSELVAGKIIGFEIVVWDYDPPQRHHEIRSLRLVGVGVEEVLSGGLLDGILLPVEPDVTAVEGSTWGRIKASLNGE